MVILNNTGSKGVRVLPDFCGKIILKENTNTNIEANIVSITSNERKSEPNSPFNLKNATFFDLDENDFVLGFDGENYMTIIDNKNKSLFRKHINSHNIERSKDISQLITNYTNNIYHYIPSKDVLYYLEQKEDYIHLFRFDNRLDHKLYKIDPQEIDGDIKCILVDEAENYCYIITSSYIYVYELKLNNNNYLSRIVFREHGGYVYGKDQEQLYVVTGVYSETVDNQKNIYMNLLKTKENKIESKSDIFIGTVDKNDCIMGIFDNANCYCNGKPIFKNFSTGYYQNWYDEDPPPTGIIKNKNIICNGNALSFNFTTYMYANTIDNVVDSIEAIEFTNAISFLNGDEIEILLITNQGDWNFLRNDGMNYSYHIDNQEGSLKENIVYYDDNNIVFQIGQKLYIWPRIVITHWNEYEYVITTDNNTLPYLPYN